MKRISLRLLWIILTAGAVFGLQIISHNFKDSFQDLLLQAGVAIILAVSLNIVNGFTGQFSIGHAGFMAVGAYAGGAVRYPIWQAAKKSLETAHPHWSEAQGLKTFSVKHWWRLPATMVIGGSVAGMFGWGVGGPSL